MSLAGCAAADMIQVTGNRASIFRLQTRMAHPFACQGWREEIGEVACCLHAWSACQMPFRIAGLQPKCDPNAHGKRIEAPSELS